MCCVWERGVHLFGLLVRLDFLGLEQRLRLAPTFYSVATVTDGYGESVGLGRVHGHYQGLQSWTPGSARHKGIPGNHQALNPRGWIHRTARKALASQSADLDLSSGTT